MAVFVDTGIFVALHNADDEFHSRSKELMKQALKSDFSRIFTSDYVIDEAITTALVRTKKHDLAIDLGMFIISSPRITKIWIAQESFEKAWKKFSALKDKPLSFTDCTSIALMEMRGIKQIMSFDSGFDGLVSRIC
ncbi:MAG: type II toxin-antitoxin system VapC family toxin [Candidatus Bathyarchaeota archaeon]|nr:type II toxin-antitoxin system VapC family toxin [Candidatus Bathyarchaeota archaeon]